MPGRSDRLDRRGQPVGLGPPGLATSPAPRRCHPA